jgi:glycosyltransferase involved in cell wall biosynthesis
MTKIVFGIPTFNGSKTICETLNSIITQNKSENYTFSILISDNNSTDDVVQVANAYLKNNNWTDYEIIKNEYFDKSFDGNVCNLYMNFNGDYLWFLSDDDCLSYNNVLNVVSDFLINQSPNVFTCNYHECDVTLEIKKLPSRNIEVFDITTEDLNKWIKSSNMHFGLISSVILKKKIVSNDEIFKFYGLMSLHIALTIISAYKGTAISHSAKFIKMRTGNTAWGGGGSFILSFIGISEIIYRLKYFGYLNREGFILAQNFFFIDNWRKIIKAKVFGFNFNIENIYKQLLIYGIYPRFWILDFILMIIPSAIFKNLYKVFKSNNKLIN